ncbi:MAG: hypothetical protein NTY89_08885 [Nostocales cyanobacterium LacPavin_0920_SED1_MAG_38_18]|nr:hypothetical protein [Dolichospermum sp. DET73]MCX5981897.1 hypothetical protein [Nostocales cyanobacterium LacPavin_0920_SED1_MAG_38_18]
MKLLKTLFSVGAIFAISTLTTVATAQESIARIRFTWNFAEPGGAIYMNICADPDFNIDAQSGGCADINVLNSVVTNVRGGTKLVTDRLKTGNSYKACLIADNIYPRSKYERKGRWITCKVFTAQDKATIGFSYQELQFVREKP